MGDWGESATWEAPAASASAGPGATEEWGAETKEEVEARQV